MPVWALLPVKDFAVAKTRLAPFLSAEERAQLAKAMFLDTLNAVSASCELTGLVLISNDLAVQKHARRIGAKLVRDPCTGLNPSLEAGRLFAAEQGASATLVLPCDIPAVCPADIDLIVAKARQGGDAVIVPDHNQTGTNALLVPQALRLAFSFGPNSLNEHCREARMRGTELKIMHCASIAHDCDVPADLKYLSTRKTGPRTQSILQTFTEKTRPRMKLVS